MKTSIGFATLLLLANLVSAQPMPAGPPPTFKVVVSTKPDKGEIIFLDTVSRLVPVQKEKVVSVIQNGQEVQQRVTVTENITVLEQRHILIDAAKSRIITPNGKQLPIDEVWKRLKKDAVVVLSGDFNTPAAAFLRALNAETLVIIPAPPAPVEKK